MFSGVAAARKEISLIKFFGARVLHDVIDRAIQVCGSLGYSSDLPLEQMYRAARGARSTTGRTRCTGIAASLCSCGIPTISCREAARERLALNGVTATA